MIKDDIKDCLTDAALATINDVNLWHNEDMDSRCAICEEFIVDNHFHLFRDNGDGVASQCFHYACAVLPEHLDEFLEDEITGWVV